MSECVATDPTDDSENMSSTSGGIRWKNLSVAMKKKKKKQQQQQRVLLLHPSTHHVEVMSAGHGPILLYSAIDDAVREIKPQGMPLGIMKGVPYDEPAGVDLQPGDFLLLTTDGFFEWANAEGELFGQARLIESTLRAKSRTSADIVESIYADVIEFSAGTSQDDDVTAVVVKRKT